MAGGAIKSGRLSKRTVDAAQPDLKTYRFWDADLKGFGLKVAPSGVKTFFVSYRAGTGRLAPKREFTIGRHGTLTADQARAEAERLLSTARLGSDPQDIRTRQRTEATLAELCDLYLADGCATKKPLTLYTDRGRIERHIKPLLGTKRVSAIAREDVDRLVRDVAAGKTATTQKTKSRGKAVVTGGKGAATKSAYLLSAIFEFAVSRRMRADNPARGVKRFRERKIERFLSPTELGRLGEVLSAAQADGMHPSAVAIVRLLALTGARRNEIVSLKRAEIDWDRGLLRLGDSKTGQKVIPLGAAAIDVLRSVTLIETSPYVFPSARDPEKPFQTLPKAWLTIRGKAGLDDVRLHDLRHSFASMGLLSGQALPLIGKLLGHSQVSTTARYAHLADDPLKNAADRIAGAVADAMGAARPPGDEGQELPARAIAI